MEAIKDTPVKRRKFETDHMEHGHPYDSQDDSGDDLLMDYDTIATVPLPKTSATNHNTPSSPGPYITQPTQIIDRSTQLQESPLVQVAASSPLKSLPIQSPATKLSGGILANAMAPPGTAFRLPMGVTRAPTRPKPPVKPHVIDLSDDELSIRYRGSGSSDEDSQRERSNIKPSTFIQRAQQISQSKTSSIPSNVPHHNALSRFSEITSKSFYNPLDQETTKKQGSTLSGSIFDSRNRDESKTTSRIPAAKRSADVMANAYGGSSRPSKQIRQTGPAKAEPITITSLDDIPDWSIRKKIKQMQEIVPSYTINACYGALLAKRGSIDDALDYLTAKEEGPAEIDLTISDDETATHEPVRKIPAKQQLKVPSRTIQEKYTAVPARNTQLISSPVAPPKPRRRLIQGRKNPSSPATSSSRAATPPTQVRRQATPESFDDSDSGIGTEVEEDAKLEGSLLQFFNACSIKDLADLAAITETVASSIIVARPFKSLHEVRQLSGENSTTKCGEKKSKTKRPIGEKIVDTCETMWTGYEAIDQLVSRCEALGKSVADEMKKWGIDVFGASKAGELEIVNFDGVQDEQRDKRMRDSGIGTPTSTAVSGDEGDGDVRGSGRGKPAFLAQPRNMAPGIILKDYQVVGMNWLCLLFEKRLSCILADDMGLGKTCQVISFLACLYEKGIKGPHLVIVPGSTLENWLREFQAFCPTLNVMPYYDNLKERPGIRDDILGMVERPNVIITTYGIAKAREDNKFLRKLKPVTCVFDEGHILKNSKSAVSEMLMRIHTDFRLLLTGTPLQNNLGELASLLGFILPSLFNEHREDLESIFSHKAKTTESDHSALLSAQRITRAKSMMTPFILRRKKHQVLKDLPPKIKRIEYCELSPAQHEIYITEQARARKIIEDREAGKKKGNETANILMNLRKASIHPLLFRRLYNDTILSKLAKAACKEEQWLQSNLDLVYEDMTVMTDFELHNTCITHPDHMGRFALDDEPWMNSGKVAKLAKLLTTFKASGDRVLVFSQFTMVMNILETVMETLGMQFFRLDGDTDINKRQAMIDQFHDDEEVTVFMLSTKAGGQGINLACANKVIIFDSSFNPQEDIQAENRAHRVGQKREVEVIRLVTRGTIEEQIHALGETKLALDDRVAGEQAIDGVSSNKIERQIAEALLQTIKEGAIAESATTVDANTDNPA